MRITPYNALFGTLKIPSIAPQIARITPYNAPFLGLKLD